MTVPFLDYSKLYTEYQPQVSQAMHNAMHGGRLILQKDVEEFESKFAAFLGVKHVVSLNSGTDALFFALIAAGVGPGDEVITVSNTFIATIQVIHHLGATPILVDVGEDGLMDIKQVAKAITDKTKAIIPVHLSGDYVGKFSDEITIIEDAAQSIGAQGIGYGLVQCYSFYPAKVLGTFGDAGALATNDDAVAKRVRALRNHGNISKEPQAYYEFGWNSRLDNVWAAVLNVKLKYLERDLARRKEIADYYNQVLKALPIGLPVNRPGRIWQDYIIRAKDKQERNALAMFLRSEHKIETLQTDTPNHLYPGLGLDHFKLPVTERITDTSLRIPCNHFMTLREAGYVADAIKHFYALMQ